MNNFINFFEKQFFGVSAWWASKLGLKPSFVRLFFIYFSFVNFGTPLVYLSMVFIYRVRNHFKYRKRPSIFDL
ncbi:MAG: PspC family transcriptional regulator [Flavobacteriales bacterium]|nr:PspC family transcriptional regulator [Flavobacteriales bacterium]MBH83229.1 PspC family transcriptional regulator [Flavobacteriales bacterium]